MERAKRSIVVSSVVVGLSLFCFASHAKAQSEVGPTGSYLVTAGGATVQLLLNVHKDNTVMFTSTTDFGLLAGRQASPSLGTWIRRSSGAIDFTAHSFIFDGDGVLVEVERITGTATTEDLFKTARLAILLEFFEPTQDVLDPDEVPTNSFPLIADARRVPLP
jgi:hypothetical protein